MRIRADLDPQHCILQVAHVYKLKERAKRCFVKYGYNLKSLIRTQLEKIRLGNAGY